MSANKCAPFATLAVALAAGCLPARDNPLDPARAPVARIRAVDASASDGACTGAEPPGGWPEVASLSHNGCLALDARLSTDPQNDDLSFTFWLLATDGNPVSVLAEDDEDGLYVLETPQRETLAIGAFSRFGVVVDDGGNTRSAETGAVLTNGAPSQPRGSSRSLPLGGWPWAPGADYAITLVAEGVEDADDDEPTYCWTYAGGIPGTDCDESGASIVVNLDAATRSRAVVFVTAADELSTSPPAMHTLTVAESDAWVTYRGSPGQSLGSSRLDATWVETFIDAGDTMAVTDDPLRLFVPLPSIGSIRVKDRSFRFIEDVPAAFDQTPALAVEPLAGGEARLWAAGSSTFPTSSQVIGFHVDAAGVTETVSAIPIPGLVGAAPGRVVVDGAGNVWIAAYDVASDLSLPIQVIAASGSSEGSVAPPSGTAFGELAPRPDSSEVWGFAQAPTGNALVLRYRLDPGGPIALETRDLGARGAGVAWSDPDSLWVFREDRGLLLVDVERWAPGEALDDAVLLSFPEILEAGSLLADPGSGRCFLRQQFVASEFFIADRDGSLRIVEAGFQPQAVDALGSLWGPLQKNGGLFMRGGKGPATGGFLAGTSVTGRGESVDLSTGGIWIASPLPELVRIGDNGSRLDGVSAMLVGPSTIAIPPVARAAFSPDGTAAWILVEPPGGTQRDLYRVDLAAPRTVAARAPATLVQSFSGADPLFTTPAEGIYLEASGPASASGFAWTGFPIGTVDSTGAFTLVSSVGLAARDPGDDTLCNVFKSAATTLTFDRRNRSGALLETGTATIGAAQTVLAVAASHDADGRVCWALAATPGVAGASVFGWSGPGAPTSSFTSGSVEIAADGTDQSWRLLVATDTRRAWVATKEVTGSDEIVVPLRIDFTGAPLVQTLAPGAVGFAAP